jgi:prepilin-type processing-associated H-X9-DG protein
MFDEIDFRDGAMPWQEPSQRSPRLAKWTGYLCVIAFVGVLIGLLLPVIQTGGGRYSRQLQCASNIRQMGLGIAQYVNAHGQFPPGTIPNPDLPLDRRLGWGITLLPYIDQVSYFADHGTTLEAAERLASDDPVFADLKPGIAHCPSSMTRANFVAIAGLGLDAPSLPTKDPRAGIFGDDRRVTPADIKDGTSTTMMLAESAIIPGPWFAGGRANVQGLNPLSQPYIGPDRQFGGLHKGGANVLMADGSVRFVKESVDPKVFEALSTIAGGEKVSATWDD